MATSPRVTVLDAIGATPLIDIDGVWLKLEYLNPSGSIKARMARYIIERAEREGLLRPGDTIVEASSGNTGNAMSMVAAVKGYKMLVVMPEGLSAERTAISVAFGAQVHTVGTFHVNQALEEADRLGALPGYFAPHQFESEWNVEENRTWLGPEILSQLPPGSEPDGVRHGRRHGRDADRGRPGFPRGQPRRPARRPRAERVVHDPVRRHRAAPDRGDLRRIRARDLPAPLTRSSTAWSSVAQRRRGRRDAPRSAREHGLLVGPSSRRQHGRRARLRDGAGRRRGSCVTIACDEGEKYLSEYFTPGRCTHRATRRPIGRAQRASSDGPLASRQSRRPCRTRPSQPRRRRCRMR